MRQYKQGSHLASSWAKALALGLTLTASGCAEAPATAVASGFAATVHPTTAVAGEIRPFQFHASDESLADLRRRLAATKWPTQELVPDGTQGVQLAMMRELGRYWQTEYDWRKVEARLNALPQFMTNIDGLDIHFIDVRSNTTAGV